MHKDATYDFTYRCSTTIDFYCDLIRSETIAIIK